jgi:hypothetical protein
LVRRRRRADVSIEEAACAEAEAQEDGGRSGA